MNDKWNLLGTGQEILASTHGYVPSISETPLESLEEQHSQPISDLNNLFIYFKKAILGFLELFCITGSHWETPSDSLKSLRSLEAINPTHNTELCKGLNSFKNQFPR